MSNSIYVPTGQPNQFLKINPHYNYGGTNMFSHKPEARGFYVGVSTVKRENIDANLFIEQVRPVEKGSFKVLVLPLKRNDIRKFRKLKTYLEGKKDEVSASYFVGDYEAVATLLKGAFVVEEATTQKAA